MFLFIFYSLELLIYCLKCHACTFVTCFFPINNNNNNVHCARDIALYKFPIYLSISPQQCDTYACKEGPVPGTNDH